MIMTSHEGYRRYMFKLELVGVSEELKKDFCKQCNFPAEPVTAQRIPPKAGLYHLRGPTGSPRYDFRVDDTDEGLVVRTNASADNRITPDMTVVYLRPTERTKHDILASLADHYEI